MEAVAEDSTAAATATATKLQFHQKSPPNLHTPDISPSFSSSSARRLCDVLLRSSPEDLESSLSATGITPTADVVHEVLKMSYDNPSSAVDFFRWAGSCGNKPTPYAWNLMVDLLGKNRMFGLMWDAIRSMKQEALLSMATFASVFGSYCVAGRFKEAVMSFDVMDRYGIQQNVIAVNSLLSAICCEDGWMTEALEFYEKIKLKIPPDGDTFAILLEGLAKEGNAAKAKIMFSEMVVQVGWSQQCMPAYDAFLTTLVCGSLAEEAVKCLHVMKGKNCLPGFKFFSTSLDVLVKQNDSAHAISIWDIMVGSGLVPNLIMYNAMIGLLCGNTDIDNAFRLLDEMVFHGAFPDFLTYNMIFRCLVKNKKVQEVGQFFYEMIKNEIPPKHFDCTAAITMLIAGDDPEMAIEIWNYMIENYVLPLDESANVLLIGLGNLGRLRVVKRFVKDMLDRRIVIHESTMARLKDAFYKEGRSGRDRYDSLLRRWKAS